MWKTMWNVLSRTVSDVNNFVENFKSYLQLFFFLEDKSDINRLYTHNSQ